MTPVVPTAWELAVTSLLVGASAGLSVLLSLGLGRGLLVATARMVVQLLVVGEVLRWVFAAGSGWVTGAVVAAMAVAAAREAGARQERRLVGWWHGLVAGAAVVGATAVVGAVGLTTALRPGSWGSARQVIPVVGIVLGTVMNATSLTLSHVVGAVVRERGAIEARLALGAGRYEAFEEVTRRAVRAGSLPVLNQMSAAGIITLPGIMTGQILAGMEPAAAARSQIALLMLLASGGVLASVGAARLAVWRLTDERARLRLDRLGAR